MGKRTFLSVVLVMVTALLVGVGPVAGQPPDALTVSGHGCSYVTVPGEVVMTGQTMHIKDQVIVTYMVSDDTTVLADSIDTSVLNVRINMKTMTGKFRRTVSIAPDGANGTFEGHSTGWFRFDPLGGEPETHVTGIAHGTGEFEGLTLKLEFGPGDINRCESPELVFDTAYWSGFIVPPGESP